MQPALHRTIPVIIFFILLFAYTKMAGPLPFSVSSVTTNKSDSFSVSGEGKVSVKPDVAVVTAGVQASGSTVKSAQEQLNSSINKISEAVRALGIDTKDIKTTNYNIHPNIDYRDNNQRIIGYSANSNLTIKVRNVDKASEVIDAATKAGSNQIGGISFEVDDKEKALNEARELAVRDAKQKAEQAAKTVGFRLGKIINYSENTGDQIRPLVSFSEKALPSDRGGTPTQIEPGSNEVVVTVNLSYEVR